MTASDGIIYCTIASANYLPRVEVLEASLAKYQPTATLKVLLCERPDVCRKLSAELGREFISPDDVCPTWLHMAFYYDITEFNTALKPFLLDYLMGQGFGAVIYFDPDIEVFSDLNGLESLVRSHDLVLTPHICEPMPLDGFVPSVDAVVRAGQFNLGFIAVANSSQAIGAIRWWQGVCSEHCIFDGKHRFFVDQFWADILPSFIQKFYCLRDPAYNMAYWNVFQRELRHEGGQWLTNTGALKFFHFSGLATHDLTRVSKHQNRVVAPVGSALHLLLSDYLRKLERATVASYARYPYSFDVYQNGEKITPKDRNRLLYLARQERIEIENPFATPDDIKKIILINVARLDEDAILRSYRRHRYLNYFRALYRQYVVSVRARGFLLATRSAMLFVMKAIRFRFLKM